MKQLVRWTLTGALLVSAGPAWAGDVKLSFSNGRVSLVATDASPREILAEWARLGQVNVTNLDRLAGTPVTLQLADVPETRALEIILRGTAGYVAAPRRAAVATISLYDRILLMPGVAPEVPAAAPATGGPAVRPGQPATLGPIRGRPGQTVFGPGAGGNLGGPVENWGTNPARAGSPGQFTIQSGRIQYSPTHSPAAGGAAGGGVQQLPTSSQVPGVPVGAPAPAAGTVGARPGQATAAPGSTKPGGQTQGPGGQPIKLP